MYKKYRVLKDTPKFKAGSIIEGYGIGTYHLKTNVIRDYTIYHLCGTSVNVDSWRLYPLAEEVENNPEWYQLIPENVTCLVVGDAMRFDNGTFMTATLTLSSPIPNEKMGDIRRAIEEVVNDKKQ